MSTTLKVVIGLVVVVVLVLGWKYMKTSQNPSAVTGTTINTQNTQSTNNSSVAVNSNTSLDQDISTIDAQMKLIDQSSASVDQSFNDTPVAQTE